MRTIERLLRNDQVSVLIIDAFPEQFDQDAPGGPRVADFSTAHGVLIDLQQLLYDVAHTEEVQLLATTLVDRPA